MIKMNKYIGLLTLKEYRFPTINWKCFNQDTLLDASFLWTIRLAAYYDSNDFGLPCYLGMKSDDAICKGLDLYRSYDMSEYIIMCYPYFVAIKSGTIDLRQDYDVIEVVFGNCTELTRNNNVDLTMIFKDNGYNTIGDDTILDEDEINLLYRYMKLAKYRFRDESLNGCIIILEWSFGYDVDANGIRKSENFLIFNEMRVI